MTKLLMVIIFVTLAIFSTTAQDEEQNQYLYTYHNLTGNRLVEGAGTFPDVNTIDIELEGTPLWVLGHSDEQLQLFVAFENGDFQIFDISVDEETYTSRIQTGALAPGQPPVVAIPSSDDAHLIVPTTTSSPLSHPIPVNDRVIYIDSDGSIVLADEQGEITRQPLNALLDGRLVMNSKGQVAFYANPTNQRYVHGIMGDDLEGASLVIIEMNADEIHTVARVDLPGEGVFEGLSPIWADVNEDGIEDLITTVSNGTGGAWIRAYLFDGTNFVREVDSSAIGQGFRWRHQLAWGAFGPDGEYELVDVLTPHIGGVVEFFNYNDSELEIVESLRGATSHAIGSRNLDMAVGGDFNSDGQIEIALLNQQRDHVVGVQHTAEGAQSVWALDGGAEIISNLAAFQMANGKLALAVGTVDQRLRIWLSR